MDGNRENLRIETTTGNVMRLQIIETELIEMPSGTPPWPRSDRMLDRLVVGPRRNPFDWESGSERDVFRAEVEARLKSR